MRVRKRKRLEIAYGGENSYYAADEMTSLAPRGASTQTGGGSDQVGKKKRPVAEKHELILGEAQGTVVKTKGKKKGGSDRLPKIQSREGG